MISVTVLTKNSSQTIRDCLDSLSRFSEVIVLDSGSTDQTIEIAEQYPNVLVHHSPFLGFGRMHQLATELCQNDWVLSVDSDEVLTEELVEEILSFRLDSAFAYEIRRDNFFNGRHIKGCAGWHPDYVARLFHRNHAHFSDDAVHEKLHAPKKKRLKHALRHTPYRDIGEFLRKMEHYSTLFSEQRKGEKASLCQALAHGWFAFFKSYVLKKGFLQGREGFIISLYNSHTTYYKYLKLSQKKGD